MLLFLRGIFYFRDVKVVGGKCILELIKYGILNFYLKREGK